MFMQVTRELLSGFGTTLEIFALTLIFAIPLGLIISFGSMSKFKPLKFVVKVFVWIIRGTPLMLQLIIIFYGPGLIASWIGDVALEYGVHSSFIDTVASWQGLDRFPAVLVAFIINYACYFSEIFRGGIESISKGQYEAGYVLGLSKSQTFFKVVLLQVVKRIVPPMSNEIITLVKDTSLARIIAVYEIIWNAQKFIKSEGLLWPLFYTGVFYLAFSGLLTLIFNYIEKKMDYFRS